MRYLLDTSALLAHYLREPGWRQVQELFDDTKAAAAQPWQAHLVHRDAHLKQIPPDLLVCLELDAEE